MTVIPHGDLARVKSDEPDDSWPLYIEIIATWDSPGGRKRRQGFKISADEFFGRGGYGAPMSGDQLIGMIERLRKQ